MGKTNTTSPGCNANVSTKPHNGEGPGAYQHPNRDRGGRRVLGTVAMEFGGMD